MRVVFKSEKHGSKSSYLAWHYEMVKKWVAEDLLELSSVVMKYVDIKDRLWEGLSIKWQGAKNVKVGMLQYKC